MQTVPHKPATTPTRVDDLTFGTQLTVTFDELIDDETGGIPILGYILELDQSGGGSGPWTTVQDSLLYSRTVMITAR